jgi:hypothetical protein
MYGPDRSTPITEHPPDVRQKLIPVRPHSYRLAVNGFLFWIPFTRMGRGKDLLSSSLSQGTRQQNAVCPVEARFARWKQIICL